MAISKEFLIVAALICALIGALGAENVEQLIRTARYAF